MKHYNLKASIEKRRIIPFAAGPKLISKELKAAKEDLKEAQRTLDLKSYKWATVQAYYAIFHAARALLYAKKYREKSHIHLSIAVKSLYVDTGVLPVEYYEYFVNANILRELADYKSKFSKEGAERSLSAAKKFVEETDKILRNRHL